MDISQICHNALALDGRWRITHFGKLDQNPLSATRDLKIEVFLGRLSDQSDNQYLAGKIQGDRQQRSVLIGEIPRLYLNAVLLDGRLTGQTIKLDQGGQFSRQLNCSNTNIHIFNRFEKDEHNRYVIPMNSWSQDEEQSHNTLFAGFGSQGDRFATIIPVYEIFRFFYATSDVMVKALLSYQFLDPETHIWNPDKSWLIDGRALLWLRKRMLDSDARFIARFAFDAYALRCAQSIFEYAAAMNAKTGSIRLRAIPPFESTVTINALGCNLNGSRKLITQMLNCDWRPNFHELRWDRDNDGRYDPDNREEHPASNHTPNIYMPGTEFPPNILVGTPAGSDIYPSRIKEREISERFPELGRVPAQKMPQEDAKTRGTEQVWKQFFLDISHGSVSEGSSSKELVGTVIIEGKEKIPHIKPMLSPKAANVDRDNSFEHILQLLTAIKALGETQVDYVVVSDEYFIHNGIPYNLFPRTINSRRAAWLYSDDERRYQRMVLIAKITRQIRTRYIFELQQRKSTSCSTLIFWNEEESEISEFVIRELFLDCAESGKANFNYSSSLNISWGRRKHTTDIDCEKSGDLFLKKIFETNPTCY